MAAREARAVRETRRGWDYRGNVAARVAAGTIGAYAVAALFAAAVARILPMARIEATITATLLAILVFPAVTIWAFLARGPWRAWGGIFVIALVLSGAAWVAGLPA